MARHYCHRCGMEDNRSEWHYAHPVAAAITFVLLGIWASAAFIAFPLQVFTAALVFGGTALAHSEYKRHRALQARFDWEAVTYDGKRKYRN